MTEARLTSAMLAGALIRRAQSEGGFAMIVVKGDPNSGTLLVETMEKGRNTGLFERVPDYRGGWHMLPCGPDTGDRSPYIARRRHADPDLWIIELDIPEAERFAAETIC